jgi:hypothetical protein
MVTEGPQDCRSVRFLHASVGLTGREVDRRLLSADDVCSHPGASYGLCAQREPSPNLSLGRPESCVADDACGDVTQLDVLGWDCAVRLSLRVSASP